jgi:predicted nucleic acid-binding Zn ribbon protein
MGSSTCQSCKAPLPTRRARCRVCGWALDYDPKTSRREREVILGIGIMVVCIVFFAIAIAIAVGYVRPLLGS